MVVDVDKLSDAELRTHLLEFGFPVMPITGTTRKVMAEKLKMLLKNKNKIGGVGGRRSLGHYSNEEESDTDVKVIKKKDNRRATMAAPLMQPPSASPKIRKSTRSNEISEPEIVSSPVKREVRTTTTTTTNRSQRIVRNAQDEFDTGSDSESDITNYQNSKGIASEGRSPLKSSNKYSTPKSLETSYSTSRNISFNTNTSPSRQSTFNSPSLASEYATDRLNQIRSRLSLNSYDKPSYSASLEKEETTPFLSNFTKRLSTLQSKNHDHDYKNDVIKEHDVNGSSNYVRSQLSSYRATRGREPTYDFGANRNNILKNNFVSFAVLAGAALFFVLLAILYMGMRSDTSVISADYIVPQCLNDPSSKKWVNCVPEEDVATALHLLNVIKPELHKRSIAHKCFDPRIKPQMTESEIINFCITNYAITDPTQIRSDLTNLMILTFNNPEWGLSVAQTENNNAVVSESDVAGNMEQVIFNTETKVTSLIILNPPLPWKCTFYKSFHLIFNGILFMIIVFGSLYVLNLGYKYYKHYKQKQKDEIGFMVERIIDILQSNVNEKGGDNFAVINHVRDMILPVGERQKKAVTWAKAVKFINENESRVRTEVQEVKGEPFDVWRWIGSANVNMGDHFGFEYRQGRRIVNLQYLIPEILKFPHKFLRFCKNSDIVIKNEIREGFMSVFILKCNRCEIEHSVCSEEPESELLNVNLAFVAGIISLGLSLYHLNELCNSLRLPRISADSFYHYLDEIYEIYNDSLSDSNTSSCEKMPLRSSTPEPIFLESYQLERSKFLKELEKTPDEIEKLSELTKDQANNSLWYEERRRRLTASNFGRICKLLDSTNRNTVVKEILNSNFSGNIYTKWGKDNEKQAIDMFAKLLGVSINACGLYIHPDYPFLAASPDGLIEHSGLVEIKCPYKSRHVTPEDAIQQKLIKFGTIDNGVFRLKKEDKYYYQVQGQLFVTGREYCYFVVWTPLGIVYDKILKDESFWAKIFPKLKDFYFTHLLPAILKND